MVPERKSYYKKHLRFSILTQRGSQRSRPCRRFSTTLRALFIERKKLLLSAWTAQELLTVKVLTLPAMH